MKKLVCYILIFAMLFGSIPVTAMAAEEKTDKNIVLKSPVTHPERGQETIIIRRKCEYLQMRFQYRVHFVIELTDAEGNTKTYQSESFKVWVWNLKDATIETVCDSDENIKKLYPHIHKVGLNKVSENLMKKALASEDQASEELADRLFNDVVEVWYEAEKGNVCEEAAMSAITAGCGFKESLQNCVDLGFTLFDTTQDIITEEGPEEITGETEEERAFNKAVNFAKATMQWLAKMWDNIMIILEMLSGLEENGAIVDFEKAVSPPKSKPIDEKIVTKMDEEEIAYHDAVYAFMTGSES